MGNGILIATETYAANVDGDEIIVHKNITRVREGHKIALQNPENWAPVEERIDHELPDVEQATQAPGEKRGSRAKKPAESAE